jgi:hypothetical protein
MLRHRVRSLGRDGVRGRDSALGALRSDRACEMAHTQGRWLAMSEQTKHFLLIGFLGMFIGSIVFCFLSFKKKENKMQVRLKCATVRHALGAQSAVQMPWALPSVLPSAGGCGCFAAHGKTCPAGRTDARAGAHLPRAACRRAPSHTNLCCGVALWLGVRVNRRLSSFWRPLSRRAATTACGVDSG